MDVTKLWVRKFKFQTNSLNFEHIPNSLKVGHRVDAD